MTEQQQIQVGNAQVSIFNVGMLGANLNEWFGVPTEAWPLEFRDELTGIAPIPVQCVHIQIGDLSLLVDAGLYDLAPDAPDAVPGYTPPPSLVEQMTAAGISIDGVSHVVITHAHFDHFNGLTKKVDGERVPVFANAQVYLGEADWTSAEMVEALRNPDSLESQTLGALNAQGKLTLVDGEYTLNDAVSIVPSPGETPGHQTVRVASDDRVLYCIGDLYHHAVELVEPSWAVTWADAGATIASRKVLQDRLADEDATLIATHIDEILSANDIV